MGEVASFLGLGERRFLPYGPEERWFRPQGLRETSFLAKKLRSWSCIFFDLCKTTSDQNSSKKADSRLG